MSEDPPPPAPSQPQLKLEMPAPAVAKPQASTSSATTSAGKPEASPKPKRVRKPAARKTAGTASRAAPKKTGTRKVAATPSAAPDRSYPLRLTAIVAAATIAIDQALKWVVVHGLDLINLRELDLLDPFLNLRMAWNEGVNFGLFASSTDVMRWVLVGIAVAVCLWVGAWVQRTRPGRLGRIAAGLLIGGALGNVIDRIAYGAVADFLNMSLPGWRNPYSFNVADIAIFAGAIGLVLQPSGTEKPRDDGTRTR